MSKRRVGYIGKEDVPVGVAFAGIVHWESTPGSHQALCNGRRFSMSGDPEAITRDRGYVITELNICKRCQAKVGK